MSKTGFQKGCKWPKWISLPHFISLYIFSFLNPKDLCAAAQDCLWMPKCMKFGWFLPYMPTDNEYGAWKHHYIACVSNLDWLTPREAAALYGTLNEPKTEDEQLQERQREKWLRKIIWEKIALCKKDLLKVRPPWVNGTCCSRLFKSKCQPRLSQTVRDRVGLHETLEKQLVLASLEALPKRSNVSGCHSYPLLSKKNWHGVYKNDSSSSHALQPHFILISSRTPAYERTYGNLLVTMCMKMIHLLKGKQSDLGYKIGIKNLLRPEVRDSWETLGSYVAPEEEGDHVDLFVPLGASEAGTEVLSQLSQLTGTLLTAPNGIATGSYQHSKGIWALRPCPMTPTNSRITKDKAQLIILVLAMWERAPPSTYFSESKPQTWSSLTDFLEDTLKSVRKQLSSLFKELQKNISGRMTGQFVSDTMSMANILNNQEIIQVLAEGLIELSKENSVNSATHRTSQSSGSSVVKALENFADNMIRDVHRDDPEALKSSTLSPNTNELFNMFGDNPLEFLSYVLLKKCSKKSKDFEGNVILTKCGPKATCNLLMKVKLLLHFYAIDSLYS
ncbi:hypothetical protein E2I00_016608 [Balaenoptera physalus]|uniref:F-box domain-containing protein n=1 Tax=Balaenoptera physalus TaxID=9770 RepID=A0A643C9B5_BALPH|nr:hypothetical protein E2I00_016608 [Balaenoptera physalus]